MTITLRSVKGSALTHGELDGNFTDLQNQLDNAAIAYDPVTLTGAGPHLLTAAAHANRLLICNHTAAMTLTLQTDAAGGFAKDDSINAVQYGAGAVTIVAGGATLRAPTGTVATTAAQYRLVGAVRVAGNEWSLSEISASSGSAKISTLAEWSMFSKAYRPGQNNFQEAGIATTTTGTPGGRSVASTSIFTNAIRNSITSATAANSVCAHLGFDDPIFAAYLPWTVEFCFGTADALVSNGTTGPRTEVGMVELQSWLDSGNPSAYFGRAQVKIGCDATAGAGAQFVVMHTDGNGGTMTQVALNGGVGLPANTNSADLYKLRIEYYPASTGSRRFVVTLLNLSTNVSGSATLTSNIPLLTRGMHPSIARGTGNTSGTAAVIDVVGMAAGGFI